MLTALALPPILFVSLGAIQLQAVFTDHKRTQDAADAAALWGAQQLTITPSGADQRTIAFADAQLDNVKTNATVTITAAPMGPNTMKVAIDTQRPSFFFNLMPLGGFATHAESVAEGLTQTPLCVLILGTSSGDSIAMTSSSKLRGPLCLVHSNRSIAVNGSALLQGATVEAATSASGPISPTASTGAPVLADPFAALNISPPTACPLLSGLNDQDIQSNTSLAAGVHGKNYRVKNGATLTLAAGEHYFCGDLEMKNNASLIGDDVVLIFAAGTQRDWKDGANVSLNGRKTGALAGLVLVDSRTDTGLFTINSDPISNITGAIYVPNATLTVDGSKQSGTNSSWTVVAAKGFNAQNQANLIINADYQGTDVPVPHGVGNKTGTTHLK